MEAGSERYEPPPTNSDGVVRSATVPDGPPGEAGVGPDPSGRFGPPRGDESIIRGALEGERLTALTRIQALRTELMSIIEGAVDTNADDEHDPEGSTIAYERARATALLADAESHMDDLDEALVRLDGGNYSICEACGRTIPTERLEAVPGCRTCIECADGQFRPL
jgi:DnaK suppressor protein